LPPGQLEPVGLLVMEQLPLEQLALLQGLVVLQPVQPTPPVPQ
jgi:hypothetical protein